MVHFTLKGPILPFFEKLYLLALFFTAVSTEVVMLIGIISITELFMLMND